VIKPKNASLLYSNGSYKIIKEVYGNQINESRLYYVIKGAVLNGTTELDLEKQKCYENPQIRIDSEKVRNTKAVADNYLFSKIIYSFPGGSEVVDKDEISNWIEFDSNLTILFNSKKIKDYLYNLASENNTYGKARDFLTSSGKTIKVGGGDYGWKIDIEGEATDLIQNILSGKTINKKPKYNQTAAVYSLNDIGFTYVEIDLSKQHLWFYKDGSLIAHGDVVTGNVKDGYKTPEGVYNLKFRIRNAVLKGENYQAKVSYWMPFNSDIGIHDATWRYSFGGTIYLTRGSHGCINSPYRLAETVFQNITVGTPIVCYY
jgi:lipoprotein-anchoring transpeptidase ErfK/SrfK